MTKGGIREAVQLLADGRVPVDLLVEPESVSLDEVADACAKLASGRFGRQSHGGAGLSARPSRA